MPTVKIIGPYRFFFYSGDGDEPPHIHVERDNYTAKFWFGRLGHKIVVASNGKNCTKFKSWWQKIERYFWKNGLSIVVSERQLHFEQKSK